MKKVFFVENYADVTERECVIIRYGGSRLGGYIAQKYVGNEVEDVMEFDGIAEPQSFREAIAKLRRIFAEDIPIFSECFLWEEEEGAEEEIPKIEEFLDEMAKKRGEL